MKEMFYHRERKRKEVHHEEHEGHEVLKKAEPPKY